MTLKNGMEKKTGTCSLLFATQLHHSRLPIKMLKRIPKPSEKGRFFAEECITMNKKHQQYGDSSVTGTSAKALKRARPAHTSGPTHSGEAAHVPQHQETVDSEPCPQSLGIDNSDAESDVVEVESPVASETPEEELGSCLKKRVRKRPNVGHSTSAKGLDIIGICILQPDAVYP